MSQENVEIVRRVFAEFGLSPTGIEEAAPAGLLPPTPSSTSRLRRLR
jgi:hypothetical protein